MLTIAFVVSKLIKTLYFDAVNPVFKIMILHDNQSNMYCNVMQMNGLCAPATS